MPTLRHLYSMRAERVRDTGNLWRQTPLGSLGAVSQTIRRNDRLHSSLQRLQSHSNCKVEHNLLFWPVYRQGRRERFVAPIEDTPTCPIRFLCVIQ